MFLLSLSRSWQLYRIENLHSPAHTSCLAQRSDKRDIPLLLVIMHVFRIPVTTLNWASENLTSIACTLEERNPYI